MTPMFSAFHRDSSWHLTTAFIRIEGDCSFEGSEPFDFGGTQIDEDRLSYLKRHGTCVRLDALDSNAGHVVTGDLYEDSGKFLHSMGFWVDMRNIQAVWGTETQHGKVYWLSLKIEANPEAPMSFVEANGTVSLKPYDITILGIPHHNGIAANPFISADDSTAVEPGFYGFELGSDSNSDCLILPLSNGDFFSLSSDFHIHAEDGHHIVPAALGRYRKDGSLVAMCDVRFLPT